jgi:hypothetical protein
MVTYLQSEKRLLVTYSGLLVNKRPITFKATLYYGIDVSTNSGMSQYDV